MAQAWELMSPARLVSCRIGQVTKLWRMICRLWRGWAAKDHADAYERVVRGTVIPGIEARRIPGFPPSTCSDVSGTMT